MDLRFRQNSKNLPATVAVFFRMARWLIAHNGVTVVFNMTLHTGEAGARKNEMQRTMHFAFVCWSAPETQHLQMRCIRAFGWAEALYFRRGIAGVMAGSMAGDTRRSQMRSRSRLPACSSYTKINIQQDIAAKNETNFSGVSHL